MYRNQMMDSAGYNRGSANMLGIVLIFVMIAIALTVLAVIGVTDAFQDAARARQIDSQTAHQEALWVADAPNLATKAAAQTAVDLANAQAEAIRVVADAEADAAAQREITRLAQVRNDQRLAREKLIGEAVVYLTALAVGVAVVVIGFATIRLIIRLVPAPERVVVARPAAPQPDAPAGPEPQPRPAPQPTRPRRPTPPAPQPATSLPMVLAVTDRRTAVANPKDDGPSLKRIPGWSLPTH